MIGGPLARRREVQYASTAPSVPRSQLASSSSHLFFEAARPFLVDHNERTGVSDDEQWMQPGYFCGQAMPCRPDGGKCPAARGTSWIQVHTTTSQGAPFKRHEQLAAQRMAPAIAKMTQAGTGLAAPVVQD